MEGIKIKVNSMAFRGKDNGIFMDALLFDYYSTETKERDPYLRQIKDKGGMIVHFSSYNVPMKYEGRDLTQEQALKLLDSLKDN